MGPRRGPDGTRGTYKDRAGACFQIDRLGNWKPEGQPCGLSALLHDPDEAANAVSGNRKPAGSALHNRNSGVRHCAYV